MASVRINVGAASDGSMRTVFKPLIEAAKEAVTQVKAAFKGIGVGAGDAFKDVPGAAAKATSAVEREAKRAADAEAREAKRAAKEKERAIEHVFQIKQRYLQQEEREAARSMAKQAAEQQKHAERTGYWSMRYMDRTMRAGASFAASMAKSAGVDLDLGAGMKRGFTLESKAVDIANQARLGGQDPGANAKDRLIGLARKAGDDNALDPNAALSVLGSFQALSSDLAGGEAALGRLAELAKATGTDFGDMGKAAGSVNAQLMQQPEFQKDTVKRTEALLSIMRHVVKQTADGSVEMSDFAKYMPRISAGAGRFGGSYAENVGNLSAIAQMSMLGGASTATEATGSAAAWARDITKKKTLAKWEGAGLSPFTDPKKKEFLRSPQEMTIEYLKKFGANQANLANYAPSEVMKRGMLNAMNIYAKAGGGESGIKAVQDRFKTFSSTVNDSEVKSLASSKMDTTESKAQVFQNQLDRIASGMATKLMPSLERLAPLALQTVDGFAKLVAWVTENPGKAVAAALVASIARAQIETVVRAGIENLLKGGGGASGGVGGVPGVINKVGTALTIAATAVTIEQVGELVIDKLLSDATKKEDAERDAPFVELERQRMTKELEGGHALDADDVKSLQKEEVDLSTRVTAAKDLPTDALSYLLTGVSRTVTGEGGGASGVLAEKADAGNIGKLEARLAEVHAALAKQNTLLGGTLKVQEVNPGASGPSVNPKGRSGNGVYR